MPRLVTDPTIDTSIFVTNQASGGNGGSRLSFVKIDKGAVMTRFQAWKQDWRIRGVEMTMSDGTTGLFGSKSGETSSFTVSPGEMLTKLNIQCSGEHSSGGYYRLGAIWMETNQGRGWGIFSKNLSDGDQYWYDMPMSGVVCGMFGRGGDDVDCLGFCVLHPIERARLVDVNYPNLDMQVVANTPTVVATEEYINETTVSQSYTLSGTKSVTVTRSWSVTTGFEMSMEVSVMAGIPEVVSGGGGVSWGVSSTTQQSRSSSTTEEQSWSWPIVCPPQRHVRATGTMYSDNIDTEYEAKVHIDLKNGNDYEYSVNGIYEGLNVRNGLLKIEDLGPALKVRPAVKCGGGRRRY